MKRYDESRPRLDGEGRLQRTGLKSGEIARGVLLPALMIGFNNAVLAEASMSYLGIGVSAPDVSLGYMLKEAQSYMLGAPWYVLCVGFVIVLLILGVSMMGDGMGKGEI